MNVYKINSGEKGYGEIRNIFLKGVIIKLKDAGIYTRKIIRASTRL